MAELTPRERLQPGLLDRLTDDNPQAQQESREQRVLSLKRLREAVVRDLAWLLNTSRLEGVQGLADHPHAQRSVINYGVPDLTGRTASMLDPQDLERQIRQAIWDFEPRILRNTVRVTAVIDPAQMGPSAIRFEIEGDLWSQPLPEKLYLKTEVDLETGDFRVEDRGNG